jgi:thioredoxin 1
VASDAVAEFTDANFQSEVLESKQPVLVDFWAEWCGPCRALGPTIDELAGDFEGKAKVGKMDIDDSRETAMQYGIQSIPTIFVFKDGEITNRFSGITAKADLAAAIDAAM